MENRLPLDERELNDRIEKNYRRLAEGDYYSPEQIFSAPEYDWPADKEGRALLAFVSHYKLSGRVILCLHHLLAELPNHFNEQGYLGPIHGEVIAEQQFSGHSWLLRGLCEYYEQFSDDTVLSMIDRIVDNLFLPARGAFADYPVSRPPADGGVSGHECRRLGRWLLSSDIGTVFMCIDGLSHAYRVNPNDRLGELLEEIISAFAAIHQPSFGAHTHCTLTATRGVLRMYRLTGKESYLTVVKDKFSLYTASGMSDTYHNLNWWGRPDSWSEPCAVNDSLMLATELYTLTGEEHYRRLAACIWHNAYATVQRDNGGAGTDTLVCADSPHTALRCDMYEAPFCCSMRMAEGLWYVYNHRDLLYAITAGQPTRAEDGIYRDGDILYAEVTGGIEAYAERFVEQDGHRLCPIVKCYRVPREILEKSRQQIRFN